MIDPQTGWTEFYHPEKGHYQPALSGKTGKYANKEIPGFWLQVDKLWEDPLIEVVRVTWEILSTQALRQFLTKLESDSSRTPATLPHSPVTVRLTWNQART